jgi:hypothetical protein
MSVDVGYTAGSFLPQWRSVTDRLVRFGANAVLATALLPYVSPIVVPDMVVQLTALGTSVGILFVLLFFARRTLSFRREDLIILSLGLLSLLYVNPNVAFKDLPATLRACGQIAMAFPVYYAVRNLYQYMSPRVFVGVVAVYCGALFLQMWLPSIYASTFAHMLSDTRWFPEDGRGPNGLCTEPSMMGNMCILFTISLYFFHREYWKSHRYAAYFVVAASSVMLVITKSGTGVVLALVVALAALLSSRMSRVAKCAILATSLLLLVSLGRSLSASDSRGASVLSGVASNPLWILNEYSFADRLLGLYVGIHQISSQPFGSFDVQIDPDATDRALDGDVAAHVWPDSSFRSLLSDLRALRYDNHGTGAVVERMGILGALIILMLMVYPRGFHGKWVVRAYIVGILLNASLFISTLWFVIACCAELQRTENDTSRIRALSIRKGPDARLKRSRQWEAGFDVRSSTG